MKRPYLLDGRIVWIEDGDTVYYGSGAKRVRDLDTSWELAVALDELLTQVGERQVVA